MVLETMGRNKEREKGLALEEILKTRMVDGGRANTIIEFWKTVVGRAERDVDTHRQAKKLLDRLKRDTELLKELRSSVRMRRDDKMAAEQEPALSTLIRMLDLLLESLSKRWWLLKAKALARFIAWNPVFPGRHLKADKGEAKKEKPGIEKAEVVKKRTDGDGGADDEDEEEYDGY